MERVWTLGRGRPEFKFWLHSLAGVQPWTSSLLFPLVWGFWEVNSSQRRQTKLSSSHTRERISLSVGLEIPQGWEEHAWATYADVNESQRLKQDLAQWYQGISKAGGAGIFQEKEKEHKGSREKGRLGKRVAPCVGSFESSVCKALVQDDRSPISSKPQLLYYATLQGTAWNWSIKLLLSKT